MDAVPRESQVNQEKNQSKISAPTHQSPQQLLTLLHAEIKGMEREEHSANAFSYQVGYKRTNEWEQLLCYFNRSVTNKLLKRL